MRDPPLTPAEKLREALAALEAAMERLAVSFDHAVPASAYLRDLDHSVALALAPRAASG